MKCWKKWLEIAGLILASISFTISVIVVVDSLFGINLMSIAELGMIGELITIMPCFKAGFNLLFKR
jgi:hypothetical protein